MKTIFTILALVFSTAASAASSIEQSVFLLDWTAGKVQEIQTRVQNGDISRETAVVNHNAARAIADALLEDRPVILACVAPCDLASVALATSRKTITRLGDHLFSAGFRSESKMLNNLALVWFMRKSTPVPNSFATTIVESINRFNAATAQLRNAIEIVWPSPPAAPAPTPTPTPTPAPAPTPAPTPPPVLADLSPEGTIVEGSAGVLTTPLGVFSFGASRNLLGGTNWDIQRNGTNANGVGSKLALVGGAVYTLGSNSAWWIWTGGGWVQTAAVIPGPTPDQFSPDGSMITAPTTETLTSAHGVWSFGAAMSGGYSLILNGKPATPTGAGVEFHFLQGKIYVKNSAGNWYQWSGITWTGTASPLPPSVVTPAPTPQ